MDKKYRVKLKMAMPLNFSIMLDGKAKSYTLERGQWYGPLSAQEYNHRRFQKLLKTKKMVGQEMKPGQERETESVLPKNKKMKSDK